MAKSLSAVAAALAVTLLPGTLRAQESTEGMTPEAMMKAMAEASQPGPEHAKLQPLAGEWTYTAKMWMAPGEPPTEGAGTIRRRWILGGRFLEETIVGTGPDGETEFEGRGIVGYDKAQGKYTYGWMCTMGTGTTTSLGECDDSGKHFTFQTEMYCPIRKQKVKGRDEIRILSPDKHTLTSYMMVGGEEMKAMEMTVTRKD